MKQAFTLIELLVVVLIIGILSAIALPQYQLAVAKSRMMTMLPVLKNIYEAQQVYFQANGVYAASFDVLDIEPPAGGTANDTMSKITYPNGTAFDIWFSADKKDSSVRALGNENDDYLLEFYYDGGKFCYARKGNTLANKICTAITGTSSFETGSTHNEYIL